MSAQDVLIDSADRGAIASESDVERKDLLQLLRVFKDALLVNIRDGDVPGLLAGTPIFRNGKDLRIGVVLALEDRVLLGWMKGILKKPVIEAIPLSSITSVEHSARPPQANRYQKVTSSLLIKAADDWELLCSPDVSDRAPLYRILVELLSGELKLDQLPLPPGSESVS